MEKQQQFKFLMFQNETNICWLDASIALIAHSRTFRKNVESCSESQINKIISAYNKAMEAYNSSVPEQKLKSIEMLETIQTSTLNYLKHSVKYKKGEPDSAFCALLNLIYQDKSNIKEYLNVSWIWKKQCSNCGKKSNSVICKPIITLSKVDTFHPTCPTSIYTCTCKSEQEMIFIYKELPPCLIFHFEKGAGTGTTFPSSFVIKGRDYRLTGIIILEKSNTIPQVNHFVTMVRNPFSNEWLECNDLNPDFAVFTPVKPECNVSDIYMAVFEAFDNMGRINTEVAIEQDVENTNVEIIELSEGENTNDENSASDSESSKSTKNDKIDQLLINDKKNTALQSLKMYDSEISEENKMPYNIKNKKVPLCNPIKSSPDKHEILASSETFDYQDKSSDEFFEVKKAKNESVNNPGHKISENSVAMKREILFNSSIISKCSTVENLEMYSNEKPKELSSKCKIEVKSEEATEKSLEAKKFKAKAVDFSDHKITDAINAGTIRKELSMATKHGIVGDMSNVRRDKVDKYDEKKSQMQIKQKPCKKSISSKNNENTHVSSNELVNKDSEDAGINERLSGNNLNPNKEKDMSMELSLITKHGITRNSLDARKNEVDKHDENKSQMQLKQKPFKKNIGSKKNNNNTSSNELENKTRDDEVSSSSERIKEKSGGKYLSTKKEENTSMELSLITEHGIVEDNSDAGKNKVGNKCDEKKSEMQLKQKSFKKNINSKNDENKYASSNEVENKANDNEVSSSSERIKERSDGKHLSPKKEKNTSMELSLITKHEIIVDNSNAEKNEMAKNDEKKSQMQIKQKSFKKDSSKNNENKLASSNQVKKRTKDNQDTGSCKRFKGSHGKCLSPNKEKNVSFINDQTASSSIADEEFVKSTNGLSASDSDYCRKESLLNTNHEIVKNRLYPHDIHNEDTRSCTGIKGSNDKCLSPNKEKNMSFINDQTASSSVADEELMKSTSMADKELLKSTKGLSVSNSDYYRKASVWKANPEIVRGCFKALLSRVMGNYNEK